MDQPLYSSMIDPTIYGAPVVQHPNLMAPEFEHDHHQQHQQLHHQLPANPQQYHHPQLSPYSSQAMMKTENDGALEQWDLLPEEEEVSEPMRA
jgi:hypothetical protein